MEIIGYFSSLLIGISLGLIGGGGSILAVPVLTYFFMLDEKIATGYSLFIVGSAALVGGVKQHKSVDWKTAIIFGIPAIIGVWVVRHYIVPILPEVIFEVNSFEFTRRMMMLGVFAVLMVVAAISMLSGKKKQKVDKESDGKVKYNYPLILIEGLIVGGLTGFVGAGGGFLIIPALVILANLDIKRAIGTSLMIIALKSLLGFFVGDALTLTIDWQFLLSFTSIALVGIFIGSFLNQFIDGKKLKKGFGYFIIAMAIFIFSMEFFFTK